MSGLAHWAQQIMALLLLFVLVSLLIPEGNLRGTVRSVMGLVLVAAVLRPVADLVENAGLAGAPAGAWLEQLVPGGPPAASGAPLLREGIGEAMAAQAVDGLDGAVRAVVTQAMEGQGYEVLDVRVEPGTSRASQGSLSAGVRMEIRARRRSETAPPLSRVGAYVAALAGVDDASVRIDLEP
ncbi:stage III sporulation protein AF [Carboxydochorda subterranea]|uniref:Stage III sporulation protein AF n=1 Tax=Carboxydichorda subterranea TaxID=3109565 RepID=A0ABZ1BZY8_9FIRM|nr:stage III sporulation protein AF [Limnochorda sp. L945t]WRP18323.1 stage III sporulation protein AF [Limnochorda sp. L945t]